MDTLRVGKYFTAEYKNAEFIGLTRAGMGSRYNPNPDFYQDLVDKGVDVESEIYYFPPHEMDVDFPWFNGHLHIINGIVFIISEGFDSYCRLSFGVKVLSCEHLTDLMEGLICVLQAGYNLGFDGGAQAKQAEIRKALGV